MASTKGRSRVAVRGSLQVVSALAILASAGQALQAQSWGQYGVYTPPIGAWGAGNAGHGAGWGNAASILDFVTDKAPSVNRPAARRYVSDTAQNALDNMATPGFRAPGADYSVANAIDHAGYGIGYSYPGGDALTPAMQDDDSQGATGGDGDGGEGFAVSNAGLIFGAAAPNTNYFYQASSWENQASSWENDDSQGSPNSPSVGDATTGQTVGSVGQVYDPHVQFFSDPLLAITTTPEPGSLALLFTGLLAIGGMTMVRRRTRRA